MRVLRESRSRDTPTAACRVPTRDEHLAECATSVSPAGGRVCTTAASGGSFAALHASRLLLQHLWATAAPVLSALGSAEAPQCSPHFPNSDFFLHCVDTDIASAPIFATRVGGWLRNTFACCVVEGLPSCHWVGQQIISPRFKAEACRYSQDGVAAADEECGALHL